MSPSGAPDPAIAVFCSYSRDDEALRQELEKHLKALERAGLISLWYDRKIPTGAEWQPELDARLEQAQIILLFVTSNFVASDFCWKMELERAMQRHRSGQARVIPILLEPVFWRLAPFAALQVLPKDGVPVTSWANRDQAYAEIVRSIQEVAEELASKQRVEAAGAGSERRLALELWTAAAAAQTAGSRDLAVVPAGGSAQYRIGDKIVVHFRSNRACYLTLLNVGTSGRLTILFPNKLYPSNRIGPDKLYTIPGPEYPFEYQLTGPTGTERLKGIATLFEVPLLPSDFDPGGGFFRTVPASAAARDIAIVEKRAGSIPEEEIAIAESSFQVG